MVKEKTLEDKTIVISCIGTTGDVVPFLGIAQELERRGAEILFLANEYFEDMIQKQGFGFLSTETRAKYFGYHGDLRIWDASNDPLYIGFDKFIGPTIEKACAHVETLYKSGKNLLIMGTSPFFNGALIAAEALNLPVIPVFLWPNCVLSCIAPPAPLKWSPYMRLPSVINQRIIKRVESAQQHYFRNQDYFWTLNGFRQSKGLPPLSDFTSNRLFSTHDMQLGLFPNWYAMPASDWPPTFRLAGFPLLSSNPEITTNEHAFDAFVEQKGKPVLFTSGTGVFDMADIVREGQEICARLEIPGVFVCADKHIKKALSSDLCITLPYLDFDYAFPRCRLVVHHGGVGTLSRAIFHGIPQLIRPLAFDQPDNADRIARLGLGDFLLPGRFTAKRAAPFIRRILRSKAIKEAVGMYSKALKREDSLNKACDLIERYLSDAPDRLDSPLQGAIRALPEGKPEKTGTRIKPVRARIPGANGLRQCADMILKSFSRQHKDADQLNTHFLWCEAAQLAELPLPVIVQFDLKRFIVVEKWLHDGIQIIDPKAGRTILSFHAFEWHYTEIVVEVKPSSDSKKSRPPFRRKRESRVKQQQKV